MEAVMIAFCHFAIPGDSVPTHPVNLDSLIKREDFEGSDDSPTPPGRLFASIKLSDLESSQIIYSILRKPDFQRGTANWSPEKVAEFVKSFLDGDLIPSIIMWRSPLSGNIFVIDGAHRLSVLIAWVHDDYGDRQISRSFFGDMIPAEQERAARKTRELIKEKVGTYSNLKFIASTSDIQDVEVLRRARNVGTFGIDLQWVNGDASKAEASFFKINQSATIIDPTELQIIKARRKPNALAARAMIRAGTGHKYWYNFPQDKRTEIERTAREIYNILFDPSLPDPIKTLDLPVAGSGYSADSVKLVFEFVNFANGFRPEMWQEEEPGKRSRNKSDPPKKLADDPDGSATLECLKKVKRIASRISGGHPSSLGLHPAVYFYSATGRYQPTAFLATVTLVQELETTNGFDRFTTARARFEEFLVKYRYFLNQLVVYYGSGWRGRDPLFRMYLAILEGIREGKDDERIALELQRDKFTFLKEIVEGERQSGKKFTTETKSAAFLREAIDRAVRCKICDARMHVKSITVDHKTRQEDGGRGDLPNAQLAHPFCNSGYKESRIAQAKKATAAQRGAK
jgi:hypothetical protein